jgi:hypothetical protein
LDLDTSVFDNIQLKNFLKGLHRADKTHRKRPKRVPITIWALAKFVRLISYSEMLVFAAVVVGFHGLFRASEIVAKVASKPYLLRKHISIFKDYFIVHLVRSKTDTFDAGVDVTIYATGGPLCPLRWIQIMLDRAPLKNPDAPVFQRANGRPITYNILQSFIKKLCAKAGLNSSRYSTHSLRIGGATTLMALGFSADTVKELGRWKSIAYQTYIRLPDDIRQKVSKSLRSAAEDTRSPPVFCGISLDKFSSFNSTNIGDLPQALLQAKNRRR